MAEPNKSTAAVVVVAAIPKEEEDVDHRANNDIPLVVAPIPTPPGGGPNTNSNSNTVVTTTLQDYHDRYAASIQNPSAFWAQQAKERLTWFRPFDEDETARVTTGSFEHGDVTWFAGGKLNVCYNCIDRHCQLNNNNNNNNDDDANNNKIAILWEGDEVNMIRKITFGELQRKVCQIANALSNCYNVQKGDVVTIYMPMSTYHKTCKRVMMMMMMCMKCMYVCFILCGSWRLFGLEIRSQ
jgi:Acetyl-coenzyme A synthetase N-terminus/AMP-binding enzyme